jgi:hypothetical protein
MLISAGENRVDLHARGAANLSATASVATTVEALADLKLTVNDPPGAIAVGADATFEVRVVNRGTKAAERIRVIGYFSDGLEPVAVQGWQADVREGEVEFEPLGRIGPGQELVLKITARASVPGNHVFRAEVDCAAPETRLVSEEWTKFYADAVEVTQADVGPARHARSQRLEIRR